MKIIGLDLGHRGTREAEHWLAHLPAVPGLVACTHLVHGERPRVVITVAVADDETLPPLRSTPDGGALDAAVADHEAGRGGRAVIYPGVEKLTGELTVAELLAASAIGRVRLLGAAVTEPEPDTVVDTRDFVRPQWMDGRLTLVATPAPAGRIAPFEVPNPTPCCGAEH